MTSDSERLYAEALKRFGKLLDSASSAGVPEPAAMTLATADADGRPSVRTMLLKHFDERGLVFYSNSHSRKGRDLVENPHASLCFFWQPLMQQVRIEGPVEPISFAESDRYWETRSRDSQLSAWASQQSDPLEDRKLLDHQVAEYREKFLDQPIPRPPHWFGYRVTPEYIEFWKSGWHWLNERVLYGKTADGWYKTLLYP
ncbi:MAG: pyridoxamine 5'-phosphate oxidase [Gammaproteobacteria bacterium]